MRSWLRHMAIVVALFVVLTVGADLLGYEMFPPLWASLPGLIIVAVMDYVGTVGVPGRRKEQPRRDEPDTVG